MHLSLRLEIEGVLRSLEAWMAGDAETARRIFESDGGPIGRVGVATTALMFASGSKDLTTSMQLARSLSRSGSPPRRKAAELAEDLLSGSGVTQAETAPLRHLNSWEPYLHLVDYLIGASAEAAGLTPDQVLRRLELDLRSVVSFTRDGDPLPTRAVLSKDQPVIIARRPDDAGVARVLFIGIPVRSQPDSGGGSVQVTAQSLPALLANVALPYDPPGIALAPSMSGFVHYWRMFHNVFELEDPQTFPALPAAPDDDRERLDRFISQGTALAGSQLLSASVETNFAQGVDDDEIRIEATFPALDVQVGFATLLRQCYSDREAASFSKVAQILHRLSGTSDDGGARARAMLKSWTTAHKRLKGASLDQLFRLSLVGVDEPGGDGIAYQERWSPSGLISAFNYGHLIHWGDRRTELIDPASAEYDSVTQQMAFFSAVAGLGHLYIGFATLVSAALGRPTIEVPRLPVHQNQSERE